VKARRQRMLPVVGFMAGMLPPSICDSLSFGGICW
jgi:hypothetical protein